MGDDSTPSATSAEQSADSGLTAGGQKDTLGGPRGAWRARLRPTGSKALLLVAIVVILVGGLVANTAQTAGGRIRVEEVKYLTESGLIETGLLYIPSTATEKTPACGVVAIHGYINSYDTMDGFSIEMARRGCVVLAPNQTGQGTSQPPAFADAFGGPAALSFINSLSIVRHDDIGLIGHSMGGWASVLAAAAEPHSYRSVVLVSSSVSTPEVEPVPGTPSFPRNTMVDEAQYSEFSQLMWNEPKGSDFPESSRMQKLFGVTTPIVQGKVYGSFAAGTARELVIHGVDHPTMTADPSAIKDAVQWMQSTLIGVQPTPAGHQIWYWDEIGTFIGLIGVGLFLFGAAGQLLKTSYFAVVARPRPENRSMTGLRWWIGAAILVLLGPVTFYWFQEWGTKTFPVGPYFSQSITTGVATWAVGGAIIGMLLFLIWHFSSSRETRGSLHSYGIAEADGSIDRTLVWRSIVLGVALVVATYVTVFFFQWAWTSDVRIWIFNIKPVNYLHMEIAIGYLWPFLIYFVALSIIVFGQLRPRVESLGVFMVAVTVLLTIGYVGFLGLEYGVLFSTGELLTSSQPLLTIVGDQFLPFFVIIGTVASYFFWKTGRIYTGVVILTLAIPAIIVAGTATQGIPW